MPLCISVRCPFVAIRNGTINPNWDQSIRNIFSTDPKLKTSWILNQSLCRRKKYNIQSNLTFFGGGGYSHHKAIMEDPPIQRAGRERPPKTGNELPTHGSDQGHMVIIRTLPKSASNSSINSYRYHGNIWLRTNLIENMDSCKIMSKWQLNMDNCKNRVENMDKSPIKSYKLATL